MRGILAAILALAATISISNASTSCSYTLKRNGVTRKYDLSALHHSDTEADTLEYVSTALLARIFVNMCGTSTSGCDRSKNPSVCRYDFDTGDNYVAGLLATQEFSDLPEAFLKGVDDGISVTYSGGDTCQTSKYATTIYVICTTNETPYIYDADENNECHPILYLYATCGCGASQKGGVGTGGIILIILACLIVLYFVLGAIYQWKINEAKEWQEFIIHREFWFSIPGLVKDGVMFIAHGFKKDTYVSV